MIWAEATTVVLRLKELSVSVQNSTGVELLVQKCDNKEEVLSVGREYDQKVLKAVAERRKGSYSSEWQGAGFTEGQAGVLALT